MEVVKRKNDKEDVYNYYLKQDNKVLSITFGGNLDLYWSLSNKDSFEDANTIYTKPLHETFIIRKDNYFIYSLFEELYEDVKEARVYAPHKRNSSDEDEEILTLDEEAVNEVEECAKWNKRFKNTHQHNLLFDGKKIIWHSDDDEFSVSNYVKIKKISDVFVLEFTRPPITEGKFPYVVLGSVNIRFRNSGSTYDPFNIIFMRMFLKLQEYEPEYHQIHLEEIAYHKKLARVPNYKK